jgi:predicted permease
VNCCWRAAARQREIAIRLSIGASRTRLIRQLLTESILLAATATAVGLLFAGWAGDLLVRHALGATGAAPFSAAVNVEVIAFTIAAAIVTVLLFGVAPAFRTTNLQPGTALKTSAARGSGARPRLQKFLVGSQVALSLVLLAGAGLFVRTLQNYARVSLGFSQEHVLSMSINPIAAGYPLARLPQLYRNLLARVETTPGVSSASMATCGLVTGCQTTSDISIDAYQPGAGEQVRVQENRISLNYFATTGMHLLEGRDFDDRDRADTPKVAIVNRAMAQHYFSGRSALGHSFGYGTHDTEIVGVVEDARVNRVQQPPVPGLTPWRNWPTHVLDARAIDDPRSIDVRRAVAEVDPNLPIDRVTTLSEQVASSLNQERLIAALTSIFGLLALGLACLGLFGVMSYAVSQRTTEFGIRMALGAHRSRVVRSVLRESLTIVVYGLVAGIPAALIASFLLSDLLFGVNPDLTTLSIAAALLVAVAAMASIRPRGELELRVRVPVA